MRIVDVHTHLYPRSYMELMAARDEAPRIVLDGDERRFVIFPGERGRVMGADHWDVGEKLAFMEREGIDRSVVSLGNPWLDFLEGAESVEAARSLNEEFAGLEAVTGGRISALGVLPNDITAAPVVAREIAAAAALRGAITGTRPCGCRLDDPRLDALWATLAETGTPLFIHPHYAVGGAEISGFGHGLPVAVGFPLETTIAIARLILSGVLHRYPDLALLVAHGGGTIPFLAGRIEAGWRSDESLRERLPTSPLEDLRRLYVDAVLYYPPAVRAAVDLVGADHVLFGTDHPFSVADPARNVAAARAALDAADVGQVLGRAAIRFFSLAQAGALELRHDGT